MAKVDDDEEPVISMTFDLFDLPTPQHKAGLAGLILQIRSMQERDQEFNPDEVPEIGDETATSVCVSLTQKSLQAMIDDLYSAKIKETSVASKWKGQKPKRTDEIPETDPKTGKVKKVKRFIYDVVEPIRLSCDNTSQRARRIGSSCGAT